MIEARRPALRPATILPALLLVMLAAPPATADDRDLGNDCQRPTEDWGDAPEGVTAYISFPTVIGKFPTCFFAGAPGTDELNASCTPIALAQAGRPTGYVRHLQTAVANYWLGCYSDASGPQGIDSEIDGKTSFGFFQSVPTTSACNPAVPIDCVSGPFAPWGSGQDQCAFGPDASLSPAPPMFQACRRSTMPITAYNCSASRLVYLNICVYMNRDGDWNDSFDCSGECAFEWAVKNAPVLLSSGCSSQSSPVFIVGPHPGEYWCRISISDEAAPDDYPWNGSASLPDGAFRGGETEDYTWLIDQPVPTVRRSWGEVKSHYR